MPVKKLIRASIPILALIGLADTLFLTFEHFWGITPPCSVNIQLIDCGTVLGSKFATFYGIPIALFGVLFYTAILLMYYFSKTHTILLPRILWLATGAGLLVSFVLLYLQLGVLHALCPFCTLSGLINLFLFPLSFLWLGTAETPY